MDNRFKNLDNELNFEPTKGQINSFFDQFDDLALDNAFVEASQKMQYPYAPAFWNNFVQQESQIIQNVNFSEAAINYSTAYHPMYWNEAQVALESEGLHYQYKAAYWDEAEKLLLAADRKVFFRKWITIASALLFIGLIGQLFVGNRGISTKATLAQSTQIENSSNFQTPIETSKGKLVDPTKNVLPNQGSKISLKNTRAESTINSNETKGKHSRDETLINKNSTESNKKSRPTLVGKKPIKPQEKTTKVIADNVNLSAVVGHANKGTSNMSTQGFSSKADNNASPTLSRKRHRKAVESSEPLESRTNTTEIAKITLADSNMTIPNELRLAEPNLAAVDIFVPKEKNFPTLFVAAQTGIGITLNTSQDYNHRIAIDLGLTFTSKRIKSFKLSIFSGFDYQNLSNFTTNYSLTNYRRNGDITKMAYGYEFDKLIKWQNGALLGYTINKKLTLNMGFAVDQYFTSKIKTHELVKDELSVTDFEWGQNDFLKQRDYQILTQIEYRLFNNLAIIASGEFGLLNQINLIENPLLAPHHNRTLLVGVKYRLF